MYHPVAPSIAAAAALLRQGELLVYPTETFFAVGCGADKADAVARVYQTKRRAVHKPLPLIAADMAQAEALVALSPEAERLCTLFWPGPLTVLAPLRVPGALPLVLLGAGKAAVRVSPHPTAQALAREYGAPLVASSANISGRAPVTDVARLDPELLAGVAAILPALPHGSGGPVAPAGGLPSSIVEALEGKRLRLVRAGAISREALRAVGFTLE